MLNTYVGWKAQVLHDLHESVPYLYDNTIGDGPYNAWLDPLLTNEWQMIGWNNVQEMTRFGMPGVFAHGDFDTWSPGYLMFIAATHNGISRLYETFGNGGTRRDASSARCRRARPQRTWYRQNPPLPRVKWSLRNNNNYEQTGLLVSLELLRQQPAALPRELLREEQAVDREGDAPRARRPTCCRPTIRGLGAQAELLRVLQKQHVEISRATAAVHRDRCRCNARPATAAGAAGGDATRRRRGSAADTAVQPEPHAHRAAHLPGGQLHHPHGPAVLAHRRRAARLPVLEPERSAEDIRTTTPGGPSPRDSASQACA